MTTEMQSPIDELRFRLHGGVYEPGDAEYAEACELFSSMIEKRPRLVARCAAPDDVVAALAFGRQHGLEITVRGAGHSVSGASLCDDGLVLDMRGMTDIEVDPKARVARVGAGVRWAELDRATQAHGLATTGGRVSTTGVIGLTLGGGSGWLERKHGLSCDNLLSAEMVTADGRLVRAAEDENPDLLWALRGGGGNFGVVTAIELRLHAVGPEVLAGMVLHPAERGRELLELFRDVMLNAPEELGLVFASLTGPDEPDIPEDLRGRPAVVVAGMYAGPLEDAESALRPIREFGPPAADFFGPMPYADFQCFLDDPPGYRVYWTAENLPDLPDEAIETIAARAATLPAGASQYFIAPWGGALSRVGSDHSPLAGRNARFIVHPYLAWEDPGADDAMLALGRAARDELKPWASGDTYLNFVADEGHERVRAGFGRRNYDLLAHIKKVWDPDDVFRGTQPIRPA